MRFWKTIRILFVFLLRAALLAGFTTALVLGISTLIVTTAAQPRTQSPDEVAPARVAIVFGAGLQRNGTPSAVLRDRIEMAARLYQAGKVEKLLMSGDNRFVDYNEPAAMREYAINIGIPDADIVLDFAGRRTYDTCYRARHIFGVEDAILVTQAYHLPRALFTCNNLGVDSNGVAADVRRYARRAYAFWNVREVPATAVAVWEVWVSRPLPVLGKPEPIFSEGSFQPAPLQID